MITLRILQNKSYEFPDKDLYDSFDTLTIPEFPDKDLYDSFDTLTIPELHSHQLLIFVHKFLHHKHLLPIVIAKQYFTINSAVHLYNTRVRENLHSDSVSTNYGKKAVRYKASKIRNQLPSSLKIIIFGQTFQ